MSHRPDTTGHPFPALFGASAPGKNDSTTNLPSETPWNASAPLPEEGVFEFVRRTQGELDLACCGRILGAANPYKEGDDSLGTRPRFDQMFPKEQGSTVGGLSSSDTTCPIGVNVAV